MAQRIRSARGREQLAAALGKKVRVQTLWLSDAEVGDVGATAIATALNSVAPPRPRPVEQRDRARRRRALARALQGNHMLLTLEMRGNRAGDEGARAAAMMPNSQALSTLDLMDNGMTKAAPKRSSTA